MALISPRELFLEALRRNAVSIILLHNHPSGDPEPSKEDIRITGRIYEAARLIGIELLDHINYRRQPFCQPEGERALSVVKAGSGELE